jgi:hypothetical protein
LASFTLLLTCARTLINLWYFPVSTVMAANAGQAPVFNANGFGWQLTGWRGRGINAACYQGEPL